MVERARTTRCCLFFFFFNVTPPTEIYTLSLRDALPIYSTFISSLLDGQGPQGHSGHGIILKSGSTECRLSNLEHVLLLQVIQPAKTNTISFITSIDRCSRPPTEIAVQKTAPNQDLQQTGNQHTLL